MGSLKCFCHNSWSLILFFVKFRTSNEIIKVSQVTSSLFNSFYLTYTNVLQLSILASNFFFPKYGCFATKALWQPHLVDIPNIVFPIQVFCYDCWLDYGNSSKFVFPFFLVDALFNLFCFHFFYVFWSSFCT